MFPLLALMNPANRTASKVEQIYKKDIFPAADADRNGRVTMDDFKRSDLLQEMFTRQQAQELLKQHGGADGALDYAEGLRVIKQRLGIKK